MSKASITTQPFPSSRKVYVQSKRQDVRVPMREISLTATKTNGATEENQPFLIYDTSGAYTDPARQYRHSTGTCGIEESMDSRKSRRGRAAGGVVGVWSPPRGRSET